MLVLEKCAYFEAVYNEVLGRQLGIYCPSDDYQAQAIWMLESGCTIADCDISDLDQSTPPTENYVLDCTISLSTDLGTSCTAITLSPK